MLSQLRQIAKHAWFELLFRSGATTWARRRLELHGEAIVLTFHRVLHAEALKTTNSPAGMMVHWQTFVDLITALAAEVEFVSLRDLPKRSPRLLAAITFDDGWSDSLRACLDILTARKIPVCIFICSDMVGLISPFWPERVLSGIRSARSTHPLPQDLLELFALNNIDLHAPEHTLLQFLKDHPGVRSEIVEALNVFPPLCNTPDTTMTWAELRELMQHGIELGSHTARHEILVDLDSPKQVAELRDCNGRMEKELSMSPFFFSYPNGSWDERAKLSVSECGYRYAFINQPGVWSEDTDPYLVPRINLSQNRLVDLGGRFSIASAHYFIFWLPYINRKRSQISRVRRPIPCGPFAMSSRPYCD